MAKFSEGKQVPFKVASYWPLSCPDCQLDFLVFKLPVHSVDLMAHCPICGRLNRYPLNRPAVLLEQVLGWSEDAIY